MLHGSKHILVKAYMFIPLSVTSREIKLDLPYFMYLLSVFVFIFTDCLFNINIVYGVFMS